MLKLKLDSLSHGRKSFSLILSFFIVCFQSAGQVGMLDNTFGSSGRVHLTPGAMNSWANSVIVQKDGRIVTVGYEANTFGVSIGAVFRHNHNGTLDGNFKSTGKVTFKFSGAFDNEHLTDVTQQQDGKLVVVGAAFVGQQTMFALARLVPSGFLDSTFGVSGKVVTAYSSMDAVAKSVEIQPDKKIVVAGQAVGSSTVIIVTRYDSSGVLDPSFGLNGVATLTAGWADDCTSLKIQNDGRILIGGYTHTFNSDKFLMMRLNPNGTFDTTFNSSGKLILPVGVYNNKLNDFDIQADGKIVAVGQLFDPLLKCVVTRFNVDGSLDSTFAGNGIYISNKYQNSYYHGVAIQPDGLIVAGGMASASNTYDFLVSRLLPSGQLDQSFGIAGDMTTHFHTHEYCNRVAIEPSGKIVAAGGPHFLVARYNSGLFVGFDAESQVEDVLRVFPIPASDLLNVDNPMQIIAEVNLEDLTGRSVYKGSLHSTKTAIELSDFPEGVYIFYVIQDGRKIWKNRIIISR